MILLSPEQPTYEEFELGLIKALGATVGGGSLAKALGYPSHDAFRKAHQRGRVPVHTFEVSGRKGRFAAVTDIAHWLWCLRAVPSTQNTNPAERGGAP